MLNTGNLGFHLHRIAWSAVTGELPHRRILPADPWRNPQDSEDDPEQSQAARHLGCLELLYVYRCMTKILERRIDWTVNEALATGATYGEIGEACGISRQAARQRWLRHRQRHDVRTVRPVSGLDAVSWDGTWPHAGYPGNMDICLVGGPCDGSRNFAKLGQPFEIEVPAPPGSTDSLVWTARYLPSEIDLSIYVFDRMESEPRPPSRTGSQPRKPRVYEIAKEFGVESKAVLAKLQEIGEFVRSASSTVEPGALRQLWDHFQAHHVQPTDDN